MKSRWTKSSPYIHFFAQNYFTWIYVAIRKKSCNKHYYSLTLPADVRLLRWGFCICIVLNVKKDDKGFRSSWDRTYQNYFSFFLSNSLITEMIRDHIFSSLFWLLRKGCILDITSISLTLGFSEENLDFSSL